MPSACLPLKDLDQGVTRAHISSYEVAVVFLEQLKGKTCNPSRACQVHISSCLYYLSTKWHIKWTVWVPVEMAHQMDRLSTCRVPLQTNGTSNGLFEYLSCSVADKWHIKWTVWVPVVFRCRQMAHQMDCFEYLSCSVADKWHIKWTIWVPVGFRCRQMAHQMDRLSTCRVPLQTNGTSNGPFEYLSCSVADKWHIKWTVWVPVVFRCRQMAHQMDRLSTCRVPLQTNGTSNGPFEYLSCSVADKWHIKWTVWVPVVFRCRQMAHQMDCLSTCRVPLQTNGTSNGLFEYLSCSVADKWHIKWTVWVPVVFRCRQMAHQMDCLSTCRVPLQTNGTLNGLFEYLSCSVADKWHIKWPAANAACV